MPATNGNTYDLSPPRPPNLTDFNGAQKVDDSNEPPDPTTMPNAPEDNTVKQTLVAMGNILPLVEVSVAASATPAISSVLSPTSAINASPASLYLTRTAAGDYTVETGNGGVTFPAFTGQPKAFLNVIGDSSASIQCTYVTGPHSNPAVRVQTYQGGALTDLNFTVQFR